MVWLKWTFYFNIQVFKLPILASVLKSTVHRIPNWTEDSIAWNERLKLCYLEQSNTLLSDLLKWLVLVLQE